MAREHHSSETYTRPVRRILIGLLVLALMGAFLIWRIDSPRMERFRARVVDRVVPSFAWATVPFARLADMVEGFRSYQHLYEQNQKLRRDLLQMKAWKEAALQLEQENAKLLDLNRVRLDPKLTFITGVVLADSGSVFRKSVLLNIGSHDGILDGWAVTDGLGLVGRISGVGARTARVLLLTDPASRIPVIVQPSGQRALLSGDNSPNPKLDFIVSPEDVRPSDRIVSSGDGGVFPAGLLVGQVMLAPDGGFRARLAADYRRLEYLRVLRSTPQRGPDGAVGLLIPPGAPGMVAAGAGDAAGGGREQAQQDAPGAGPGAAPASELPAAQGPEAGR